MLRLFPPPAAEVELDRAYWTEDVGRQWVVAAMIAGVDGAAALNGRSGGLGGPADRRLFALLRAQAEVLLVGASTVRAEGYAGDEPSGEMRDIRRSHGLDDVPRIAVISGRLDLDPEDALFSRTSARPYVITCATAPAARRAALADRAEFVVAGRDRVDIAGALDELAGRGVRRISCEGGPTVLAQVVAARRLDELSLTLAPLLVGGAENRILAGPALTPPQRLQLRHVLYDDEGYLFLRYRCRA